LEGGGVGLLVRNSILAFFQGISKGGQSRTVSHGGKEKKI
jgi:hypothetical protein